MIYSLADLIHVTLSYTHVVASSACAVFVWHYRTVSSRRPAELGFHGGRGLDTHDSVVHIDDTPTDASNDPLDFKKASWVSNSHYL